MDHYSDRLSACALHCAHALIATLTSGPARRCARGRLGRWRLAALAAVFGLLAISAAHAGDAWENDNYQWLARPIALGQTQTHHSIAPADDVDCFTFTLPAPATVQVETSGTVGDTSLCLFNESYSISLFDDDGGCGQFSRVKGTLPAGNYYVMVESNGDPVDDYSISLKSAAYLPDAYEDDDSTATATRLLPGAAQAHHSISPDDDADWFVFSITQPSTALLQVDKPWDGVTIGLYDAKIQEIFSPDYAALPFSADSGLQAKLNPGTYYAKVTHGVSGREVADYSISLSVKPFTPDAYEPDDWSYQATPIQIGEEQNGHNLHLADPTGDNWDWDWVTFTLDAPTTIVLTGKSSSEFLISMVIDDSFNTVGDCNIYYYGNGSIAQVETYLPAGTYYGIFEEYGHDAAVPDYSIALDAAAYPPDAYENDDTTATAKAIRPGESQRGRSLHSAYDEDWIRFTLDQSSMIFMEVVGDSGLPRTTLYDDQMHLLSTGYTGLGDSLLAALNLALDPGTYYVRVDALSKFRPIQNYTLNFEILNAEAPRQSEALMRYGLGVLKTITLSPDGKILASAGGVGVALRDLATGDVIRTLSVPGFEATSVAFSPDGTQVLAGGLDNTARLWNLATGQLIRTFEHRGEVEAVAFSPDGRRILTGSDTNSAYLWDAATGRQLTILDSHTNNVTAVAFSPDGKTIATASADCTVKLWDGETGGFRRTLKGDQSTVNAVVFSPSGAQVLSGGVDGIARLWDVATGAQLKIYNSSQIITCVAFSPDGALVVLGGRQATAMVYDAQTAKRLRTLYNPNSVVCGLAFTDARHVLVAGGDVTLWDLNTYTEGQSYADYSDELWAAAYSPDGQYVLTGGFSVSMVLRNAATGQVVRTLTAHKSIVNCVAFSKDGALAASGDGDGIIHLWNTSTWRVQRTLEWEKQEVKAVALSPDGSLLAAAFGDGVPRVWETKSGRLLGGLPGHQADVTALAFAPDGKRLLSGSRDHTARLWDVRTMDLVTSFTGHLGVVSSVAFSPDGKQVATGGGDNTVRLWDASTGHEQEIVGMHTANVSAVAFSPDGKQILSGDWDGVAKLWDGVTAQPLRRLFAHGSNIMCAAFSPDGRHILTGSRDGMALSWEINPPKVIILAGGGDFIGNSISRQTDQIAAYAYDVLRSRGYRGEDILYLSAFGDRDADGDLLNDVDAPCTLENLQAALTGAGVSQTDGSLFKAAEAGRLLVLMVDHGYKTNGFMAFRLNPTQAVAATAFAGWIDQLQGACPKLNLSLMVDCCYSGAFIEPLAANPQLATRRLLIASTSADKEAMFVPPPDLTSFSFTFLSSAYMGNSFGQAWRMGQQFFRAFPVAEQRPAIFDGSTPGLVQDDQTTITAADSAFLGKSWTYGVQPHKDVNQFFPAFDENQPIAFLAADGSVRNPVQFSQGEPFKIRVKLRPYQRPDRVTVAVRPPAPDVIAGQPVTALPLLELKLESDDTSGGQVWAASIDNSTSTSVFYGQGAYLISATARFGFNRISNPQLATVIVSQGLDPDQTPVRAVIAVGQGADAVNQNPVMAALGRQSYEVSLSRFRDRDGAPHPEWIDYFTPLAVPERDSAATDKARLLAALKRQGDPAATSLGCLYVHLIAPAAVAPDSATSPTLLLDRASGVTLGAKELDSALDAFQALPLTGGLTAHNVVIILDTPYAGAWLKPLAGAHRTVICSCREGDSGLYQAGNERLSTFSGRFMLAAAQGASLREAFRAAQNFFRAFTVQAPVYDDNGDGIFGNELWTTRLSGTILQDGARARDQWWGRRYTLGGAESALVPFVLGVEPTSQTLNPGQTVTLKATLLEGVRPARVVARLLPPASARAAAPLAAPIREVELTTASQAWVWTASFPAPADPGEWDIAVVAQYANGPDSGGQPVLRESEPVHSLLIVRGGPAPDAYDATFADDRPSTRLFNNGSLNIPQRHNFDSPDDEDWYRVDVLPNVSHSIRIDTQGADANAVLGVYLHGLNNPPLVVNDGLDGPGEYELLTLPTTTSGPIYCRVTNRVRGGLQTGYTILFSRDIGPSTGVPTVGLKRVEIGPQGGAIPDTSRPGGPLSAPSRLRFKRLLSSDTDTTTDQLYRNLWVYFPPNALARNTTVQLFGPEAWDVATRQPQTGVLLFDSAFAQWRAIPDHQANFTPFEINLDANPPVDWLNQKLCVQMEFLPGQEYRLNDGNVLPLSDLPAGTYPTQAQIWAWRQISGDQGVWEVVADVGEVTVSGRLVYAEIDPARLHFTCVRFDDDGVGDTRSVFLAVAPTGVAPTVQFKAAASSGLERLGLPPIEVTLSSPCSTSASVRYRVTGGSASAGSDYQLAAGVLTFAAGQTVQTIPLKILEDGAVEGTETVLITLEAPQNAILGTGVTHTYTILDDGKLPQAAALTRLGAAITSGTQVKYDVTFNMPVSGVDAGDFAPRPTGLAGAGVLNVSGSGNHYVVTLATGTGEGTLGLELLDNDTILDAKGNPLGGPGGGGGLTAPGVFTIDHTAPRATIQALDKSPTSANTLRFAVHLSEALAAVPTPARIKLTGNLAGAATVSGSGLDFTVSLTPADPNANGELGFQLLAGLADLAGNPLAPASSPVIRVLNLGSLDLRITPATAAWRLRGTSGVLCQDEGSSVVQSLQAGAYVLDCLPLAGWAAPTPISVAIQADQTTLLNVAYQRGCGVVCISVEPSQTNWTLKDANQQVRQGVGNAVLESVPPGAVTLTWTAPAGYETPKPNPATGQLTQGGQVQFTEVLLPKAAGQQRTNAKILRCLLGLSPVAPDLDLTKDSAVTIADLVSGINRLPVEAPASPTPANGATKVNVGVALDWTDSPHAQSYLLFFWKASDPKSTTSTALSLTRSVYLPASKLKPATAYCWQVVACGNGQTAAGPVWSFTTASAAAVVTSPTAGTGATRSACGAAPGGPASPPASVAFVAQPFQAMPPLGGVPIDLRRINITPPSQIPGNANLQIGDFPRFRVRPPAS